MAIINKKTFTIRIGNDFQKLLEIKDSNDVAIDVTGYSFKMDIRKCKNDADVILSLTSPIDIDVSDAVNGNIVISISDTVTLNLNEGNAVYDLQWTTDLGIITTILEGNIQILETVTK